MRQSPNAHASGRPPAALAWAACAAVIVIWGIIHLLIFRDAILPLTYVLPLFICVWTHDKRMLWGMAGLFTLFATLKVWWVMPEPALPAVLDWTVYLSQLANIGIAGIVVHAIIELRAYLERKNAALAESNTELETANEELAAREEEIGRQNEELQTQSEELAQQNEELRGQGEELEQQTEELARQAEELRAANEELARREDVLQMLLSAGNPLAGEVEVLSRACQEGLKLLGPDVTGAAVMEARQDMLHVYAHCGVKTDGQALVCWPLKDSLARLAMAENRTVSLDDLALRPDLVFPQADGGVPFRSILAAPLTVQRQATGAVEFYSSESRPWTRDQFRLAQWVAVQCSSVLEMMRLRSQLQASEQRLRTMADAIPQLAWIARADGWITWYNRRWYEYTGTTPQEMEGWGWQSVHDPQTLPAVMEQWKASIATGNPFDMTFPLRGADGRFRPFLTRVMPLKDERGQVVQWFGTNTDITDLRRRQEEVQRLNRTLKALSDSSQAMGRAKEEAGYLSEVCRIIVEDCGHAMVWIGYAEGDAEKSVRPVAWSGFEQGYLESLHITWADSERGRGPTGTAIRTGQACICRNMQTDPRLQPWRTEAVARGYRSSIALPLMRDGTAFGALTIYSSEPDPFTEDEASLLKELADDLASGITSIRLRKANAEDHAALARLHDLSARLVSQDDLQKLLQEVIDAAVTIAGAAKGTLHLLDSASGTLRLVAQRGFERGFLEHSAFLRDEPVTCGEAMRQARRVLVPDVAQDPAFQGTPTMAAMRAAGVRAVQSTPLIARDGAILGVVSKYWTEAPRPDEGALQRLDLLAREAAHLIEHRQREQALAAAKVSAERAREAAESASKAKDQFLAVLSHELRTPLNPALMAATILEKNPQLPSDLREDVRIIRRNVELEARLIDDMLDLTRIARGKLTLVRRIVDSREVLRHAVETCQAEAVEKELALEVKLPDQPIPIDADPARMQQVFWNLLKNAIKFTPPRGRITVTAAATPQGGLRVEVNDTGSGIEKEILERIFDAFEQGSSAVTKRYGGLGLGLAICKGLVAMHDGTINAFSDGPGKGSTFVVELPPPARQQTQSASEPHSAATSDQSPRSTGCRILLVEDHESTAVMTARLLRSFGHEVATADCVKDAMRKFEEEPFDLLISDLGLPDGSGQELIRQLLTRRPVKAIALSGYGMEADVQQSAKAGFLEHLVKPINAQQLEDAINRVVGR